MSITIGKLKRKRNDFIRMIQKQDLNQCRLQPSMTIQTWRCFLKKLNKCDIYVAYKTDNTTEDTVKKGISSKILVTINFYF